MHYTSLENIHRVIDHLFLDGLKGKLAAIKAVTVERTRKTKPADFQRKPAGLPFLESKVQAMIQFSDCLAV